MSKYQPSPPSMRIHWVGSIPFFAFHILAIVLPFFAPFSWEMVALCVGSYSFRMFFVTSGYHRYFSHRSFKVSRWTQFWIAFVGTTAAQKGPLWWCANHRIHHRYSDQEVDVHSPVKHGFWWSHVGWILSKDHNETRWEEIPDLVKYPELVWLNRYPHVGATAYAIALFAAFGWAGFVWGFVVSTVVLWHGTFTINSLSHVYGSQRYATTDTSRNNFWLALITLGEGWHNNHHCYMASVNQGFYWWEVDITYSLLKALSWLGVTRDLKKPPLEALEKRRLRATPPPELAAGPSSLGFPQPSHRARA